MQNLHEFQKKLQKDSIFELDSKLRKEYENSSNKKRVYETVLKKYIEPISNDIDDIFKKNLSTALAKIFKKDRELFGKLDFDRYKDFEKIKRLKQNEVKDYLIEDFCNYLSNRLLNDKNEKNNIIDLIKNRYLKDFDSTIDGLELQQKQALSLFCLPLNSKEVVLASFKAVSNLIVIKESDEDDKVHPASRQNIIKEIAEALYNEIDFRLEGVEEVDNDHLLEMGIEIFVLFKEHKILEEDSSNDGLKHCKLSEELLKDGEKIVENIIKFTPPFFKPMVVKPLEWRSVDDGGFLKEGGHRFRLLLQKYKTKREKRLILEQKESISKDLLKAINIIQSTRWQINKRVLKVAKKYIEDQLKVSEDELKKRKKETKEKKKEINSKIKELKDEIEKINIKRDTEIKSIKKYAPKEEQDNAIKEVESKSKEQLKSIKKEIKKLKVEKYELMKDLKSKISKLKLQKRVVDVADEFKDFEDIYFVYQVDFRGRLYAVQGLLQPQGDDLAKSLLTFSKKLPLGDNGIFWLKVHGANCYGVDKTSFKERIKWVDKNEEKIKKIAKSDDPFDDDFLKKADDPFKFLAFCYEYSDYLSNPKDFKSSLPIAIDGSNNGFQHISTLLRDKSGALKVNVLPNKEDCPADIYNEVAKELEKTLDDELKKELEENGVKIDRNFVKKGVMTDSYGAGRGAKAKQIEEYIEDKYGKIDNIENISVKIAKFLDKAIDKIAPSSAKYKKWMKSIAKLVSEKNRPIVWHTPFINFKVIQAEYKVKKERIVVKKESIQIVKELDDIDKNAQLKAIAPNFIHSLDATHLYLTILECYYSGIDSFATVHDSFATHACNVQKLSDVLKEQFIKLAKYDVLKKFQEEIAKEYGLNITKDKKDKESIYDILLSYVDKDFDVEQVKESKYFFA